MICRGIAEDAERAIFSGWRRRGVPVAAGGPVASGPGRRRRVVQAWPGIGCGASGLGRGLAFGGAGRRLGLPALGSVAVDLWPWMLAVWAGPG